jgi:hypothetical protein
MSTQNVHEVVLYSVPGDPDELEKIDRHREEQRQYERRYRRFQDWQCSTIPYTRLMKMDASKRPDNWWKKKDVANSMMAFFFKIEDRVNDLPVIVPRKIEDDATVLHYCKNMRAYRLSTCDTGCRHCGGSSPGCGRK